MQVPTRRYEIESQRKKRLDYHLTPAAIERLKKELDRLQHQELPPALREMQRTGANGDFSENAEYQYAKSEVRRMNNRILSLRHRLARAIVIVQDPGQFGQIEIGSTVKLRVNNKEVIYEIVGSQEASPGRGRISHSSPLGSLLLHHKVGDTLTLAVGDRRVGYEVLSVT